MDDAIGVTEYKVGDLVALSEAEGHKGKIVDITKPLGTYCMYTVQSMHDGSTNKLAKHQLVEYEPCGNDGHPSLASSAQNLEAEEVSPEVDPVLLSLLESDMDLTNETVDVTILPNQQTNQPNAQNDTSRFIPVADQDIENFIQNNENSNTRRKTLGHIKLVQSFLLSQGETTL